MESNIFGNFGISTNEDDIEEINSIESQFETTNNININLRAFQKNKNWFLKKTLKFQKT